MSKFIMGPKQKAWIEALRSGDYSQTSRTLHDNVGFCCLGIAAEVVCKRVPVSISDDGTRYFSYSRISQDFPQIEGQLLTPDVVEEMGFFSIAGACNDGKGEHALSDLNDNGMSFGDIADLVEDHPELYFRDPR